MADVRIQPWYQRVRFTDRPPYVALTKTPAIVAADGIDRALATAVVKKPSGLQSLWQRFLRLMGIGPREDVAQAILDRASPAKAAQWDAQSTINDEGFIALLGRVSSDDRIELDGVRSLPSPAMKAALAEASARGVVIDIGVDGSIGIDARAIVKAFEGLGLNVRVGEPDALAGTHVRAVDANGVELARTWANWAGTVQWAPGAVYAAKTVEDVQDAVKVAFASGRRVKVVGSGHSWSGITKASDGDVLVNLHQMSGVQKITRGENGESLVTVAGGTTLRTLTRELDENGLAIKNLGTVMFQTIAGVVATNTHGTGIEKGGFGTMVESLEFIDGRGERRTASAVENPEVFRAVRTGLGLAGIITSVTLRVDPAYQVEVNHETRSIDQLCDQSYLDSENAKHEWFQFFVFPYTKSAWVMTGDRVAMADTPEPRPLGGFQAFVLKHVEPLVRTITTHVPALIAPTSRMATALMAPQHWIDKPHNALTYEAKEGGNHGVKTVEYFFPAEHAGAVLKALQNLLKNAEANEVFHTQFYLLIRFLKGDDTFLSPVYTDDPKRRFAAFTIPYLETMDAREDFFKRVRESIEMALADSNSTSPLRVHWGKLQAGFTPADVRERYPELEQFKRVRDELDPKGVFYTPWAAKWLGPREGSS